VITTFYYNAFLRCGHVRRFTTVGFFQNNIHTFMFIKSTFYFDIILEYLLYSSFSTSTSTGGFVKTVFRDYREIYKSYLRPFAIVHAHCITMNTVAKTANINVKNFSFNLTFA